MEDFYGTDTPAETTSETQEILEMVRLRGFAVLPRVLDADEIETYSTHLDAVYEHQEAELGADTLEAIGEANVARCPLAYDNAFLDLARMPRALEIVRAVLGDYVVLHLQNGILVHSDRVHHQSAWHRDLPYQEYVSSRPLALNVFVCLEEFSPATGGTLFLPFSHRSETLPSQTAFEALQTQPEVPAGSAIIFDSMVFHRAGYNTSGRIRRGVNHVYTTGILRQQIDLPRFLAHRSPDLDARARREPELGVFLGYDASTAESVDAYRRRRLAKVRTRAES